MKLQIHNRDLSDGEHDLQHRVAYLESALRQRTAEAEEWMTADSQARRSLASAREELALTSLDLTREKAAKEQAESRAARLTQELELLTELLESLRAADAERVEALEAALAAALSEIEAQRHKLEQRAALIKELEARVETLLADAQTWPRDRERLEKELADERLRADQYRDVADQLHTLCTYQRGELATLRAKVADLETEAAALREAKSQAEAGAEKQRLALSRLRRTISWRATAPARNLAKLLKRLLKALRPSPSKKTS